MPLCRGSGDGGVCYSPSFNDVKYISFVQNYIATGYEKGSTGTFFHASLHSLDKHYIIVRALLIEVYS